MTLGASGLLLLHASYLGWGLALLRGAARAAGWRLGLLAPLAWLAGVLVHVVALLALLALRVAGGDPSRFGDGAAGFRASTWGLVALGIGLGLASGGQAWREARARGRDAPPAPAAGRRAGWPLLLAAPPALLVALSLVGLPDTAYDSVAFWNVKAEVLLGGRGLDAPELTDPRRVHANPSYPLARPLFTAEQYVALGRADDLAAKPAYLVQLAAGLALLFGLLRSEAGTRAAALALALLAWTPFLATRGEPGAADTTYVDLPALAPRLAAEIGGSLVDLPRWGLLGPLVVGLLAAGLVACRRRAEGLLGLVPLAQLAVACVGLGLLELQKGGLDNWMAHAWDRFLLQLVPGALLVALALLARRRPS